MTPKQIHLLKQPAKNRDLYLTDLENGKIMLDGKEFEFFKDAEDYLIGIARVDI